MESGEGTKPQGKGIEADNSKVKDPLLINRRNLLKIFGSIAIGAAYLGIKNPGVTLDVYKSLGGKEIPLDIVNFLSGEYMPPNYQDYITPENEKIKNLSTQINIESYRSMFDHKLHSRIVFPEQLKFEYKTDKDLFGIEDKWQKPIEYLEIGKGDCEDHALIMNSVFEAKGDKARMVAGYIKFDENKEKVPHWNAEIFHEGDRYVSDVNWPRTLYTQGEFKKKLEEKGGRWEPLGMFGKDLKFNVYEKYWK